MGGYKVLATIRMYYHTFLRYWHTIYEISYSKIEYGKKRWYLADPPIKCKTRMKSRRKAREFAISWMREAIASDVDLLGKFYKKQILETVGGKNETV